MEREGLIGSLDKDIGDGLTIPLCNLTPFGSQVMRGTGTFKLDWPARGHESSKKSGLSRRNQSSFSRETLVFEEEASEYGVKGTETAKHGIRASSLRKEKNDKKRRKLPEFVKKKIARNRAAKRNKFYQ